MPKQEYPMVLYNAAGDAKTVNTPEQHEALKAEDWAEDPDTAAGKPKPDADRPADAPWLGDVPAPVQQARAAKVEYPMYLHHVSKEPVLVQNAAQHAALGEGWYESPAEASAAFQALATFPVPKAPVPGEADNTTTEQPSKPPAEPNPTTPLDVSKMSVAEAELYIATVGLEELSGILTEEEKGKNRVGVKKAIEARLEVLAKEPAVTDAQ